ncbi:hypothetical protein BPT24_290 [Tenacibaculum phage pT24]|uniref:Uncharacterized protein n=1 Tax=Tenacibaculum phage pT24 TaxID=1880590 RepID=A0A1B4XX82_9CAUD|nr:hypothetical protein HYP10_gp237 [Tenacibaculum phage pT24]BAV39408.1 hypothetical protein BPT24_290 [Tenacibaculum phage pT24]
MKTFTELYNKAIEKGLPIDTYTEYFSKLFDGEELEIKRTVLIIECEEDINYIWNRDVYNGDMDFRIDDNFDDLIFFDGRYNRKNGAKQCTYKKEQKALRILGL